MSSNRAREVYRALQKLARADYEGATLPGAQLGQPEPESVAATASPIASSTIVARRRRRGVSQVH